MLKFFSVIREVVKNIETEKQPKYNELKISKKINRLIFNAIKTIKLIIVLLFYTFIALLIFVAFVILTAIVIGYFDTIIEIIINHFNTS